MLIQYFLKCSSCGEFAVYTDDYDALISGEGESTFHNLSASVPHRNTSFRFLENLSDFVVVNRLKVLLRADFITNMLEDFIMWILYWHFKSASFLAIFGIIYVLLNVNLTSNQIKINLLDIFKWWRRWEKTQPKTA